MVSSKYNFILFMFKIHSNFTSFCMPSKFLSLRKIEQFCIIWWVEKPWESTVIWLDLSVQSSIQSALISKTWWISAKYEVNWKLKSVDDRTLKNLMKFYTVLGRHSGQISHLASLIFEHSKWSFSFARIEWPKMIWEPSRFFMTAIWVMFSELLGQMFATWKRILFWPVTFKLKFSHEISQISNSSLEN